MAKRPVRRQDLRAVAAVAQHLGQPLVQQVRAWKGDPEVQLRRKVGRAQRRRTRWAYTATGCAGIFVVLALTGAPGVPFAVFVVLAVLSTVAAVRAQVQLRDLRARQAALPPKSQPAAALPPRGSLAHDPMRRLAGAEASLADLLDQLDRDSRTGTVPASSVREARETGAEAAEAIRAVATRLTTLETATQHTSAANRAELTGSVRALHEQLEVGLDGYGDLIAAAGRVVAEGASGGIEKNLLVSATDRLAGLALALRELSGRR